MEKSSSTGNNADKTNDDHLGRSCPFCYKIFYDKSSCKRHVKNMHKEVNVDTETERNPQKKLFNCELCCRKFLYSWSLQLHLKYHDKLPKENFKCKICDKTFKYEHSLEMQVKKHEEEEKGFQCDLCTSNFTKKKNLYKHRGRVHGLHNIDFNAMKQRFVKDKICRLCQVDFGSNYEKFEAHIIRGNCAEKNVTFSVNDLERIKCEYCEKSYFDNDSLQRHIRWKHKTEQRVFPCTKCEKFYRNKSSLVNHVKKLHKN